MSILSAGPKIELPKLEYGYADLEPVLTKENLELHHSKHHKKYVDKYNTFVDELKTAMDKGDLEKITELTDKIKFNGGSHINHSLYWKMLAPIKKGGGVLPAKDSGLGKHITATWGSHDNFMNTFMDKAAAIQGVGWAWLVYCKKTKQLAIKQTKDQDPITMCPDTAPILTIDIWEHAFYPSYKNEKEKYLKEIWKVVNWKYCEQRYKAGDEKH